MPTLKEVATTGLGNFTSSLNRFRNVTIAAVTLGLTPAASQAFTVVGYDGLGSDAKTAVSGQWAAPMTNLGDSVAFVGSEVVNAYDQAYVDLLSFAANSADLNGEDLMLTIYGNKSDLESQVHPIAQYNLKGLLTMTALDATDMDGLTPYLYNASLKDLNISLGKGSSYFTLNGTSGNNDAYGYNSNVASGRESYFGLGDSSGVSVDYGFNFASKVTLDVASAPEVPGPAAILPMGIGLLAGLRRRNKKQ